MAVAHKGSISIGLVLIPVGLYKTTVDNDIHFTKQIPKVTLDKNELDMAKMLVDNMTVLFCADRHKTPSARPHIPHSCGI